MASQPKPPVAEWLIAQRKARGESVEDVARLLDRSPATVRGWEAGRPPAVTDPSIVVLESYYGSVAPRESSAVSTSDMVAAIDRQTEAIDRQTAMLERVLMALVPTPPDPLIAQAQEAWSGAERRLAAEKAGTTSLPRRPSRARQREAPGQVSREAERA